MAGPVPSVGLVAPSPPAAMLPVEEGGAGDAGVYRPGEDAAPSDLPSADQRVKRCPCHRVARAVARCRDLHHDARVRTAVGVVGQLDVPVAVLLHLLAAPYPPRHHVNPELAVGTGSAAVA